MISPAGDPGGIRPWVRHGCSGKLLQLPDSNFDHYDVNFNELAALEAMPQRPQSWQESLRLTFSLRTGEEQLS